MDQKFKDLIKKYVIRSNADEARTFIENMRQVGYNISYKKDKYDEIAYLEVDGLVLYEREEITPLISTLLISTLRDSCDYSAVLSMLKTLDSFGYNVTCLGYVTSNLSTFITEMFINGGTYEVRKRKEVEEKEWREYKDYCVIHYDDKKNELIYHVAEPEEG